MKIFLVLWRRPQVGPITFWSGSQMLFSCGFHSRDRVTDNLAEYLRIKPDDIAWFENAFGATVFEYDDIEYKLSEIPVY